MCEAVNKSSLEQVPDLVQQLYRIVAQFEKLFGRPFTLDGHLVGSLGEVIAAHTYDLNLFPPSESGRDALSTDGRSVEIKLTQGTSVSLRREPEHLLVLKLNRDGTTEEIYNGPGSEPWKASGKMQKNGQRPISLTKLGHLMKAVPITSVLAKKNSK